MKTRTKVWRYVQLISIVIYFAVSAGPVIVAAYCYEVGTIVSEIFQDTFK